MRRVKRFFLNSALVLGFPFLEFIALRYTLHSLLKLQIGFGSWMVDADLLFPLPCAFLVYFFCLSEARSPEIRLRAKETILHLGLLFLFLCFSFFYQPLSSQHGVAFKCFWWVMALSTLGSGFFVWLGPRFYFDNPNRLSFIPCLIMAVSILLTKQFYFVAWEGMRQWLHFSVCPIVQVVTGERALCLMTEAVNRVGQRQPMLSIISSFLRIHLGPPCGGMDGLLFFWSLSLTVWILFKESLTVGYWFLATAVGLVCMMLLNALRIGLLFSFSILLNHHSQSKLGSAIFLQLGHLHAGWVIYLVFGVAYYGAVLWAAVRLSRLTHVLSRLVHVKGFL